MNRRSIAAIAASLAAVLSLAACSYPDSSSPASESSGAPRAVKSIFFSNILPSYPPLAEANKCFLAEAKKLGVKAATAGPTGLSTNNQYNIDRITQATANNYDAIISQPIDKAQFNPALAAAKAKGIYLATLNTGNTTTLQNFTIGTDYTNQGKTVSKELSARTGDQYVGIIGDAPTGTNNLFVSGFKAGIESQGLKNVHFVINSFDQGDPSKTVDVVNQMLTAHPNINVVLSWQGEATSGIITAIKEKNAVGKVVGVTNDVSAQVDAGIKSGVLYGSSKQNFCKMATKAVDNLVALGKGKTVPSAIDTGITFVTKANVDTEGK